MKYSASGVEFVMFQHTYKAYKVEMTMPSSHGVNESTPSMFSWLVTNVGKRFGAWNWIWRTGWHNDTVCVYFKCEEDKVKFILRWL